MRFLEKINNFSRNKALALKYFKNFFKKEGNNSHHLV
jgi:hypothetical protein